MPKLDSMVVFKCERELADKIAREAALEQRTKGAQIRWVLEQYYGRSNGTAKKRKPAR